MGGVDRPDARPSDRACSTSRTGIHPLYAAGMSRYDSDPQTAEAELRAASDEVTRLEDDLANAREMHERFDGQFNDTGSEDEKERLMSVMQVVEREIEGLEQDVKEASDELGRLNNVWFEDEE